MSISLLLIDTIIACVLTFLPYSILLNIEAKIADDTSALMCLILFFVLFFTQIVNLIRKKKVVVHKRVPNESGGEDVIPVIQDAYVVVPNYNPVIIEILNFIYNLLFWLLFGALWSWLDMKFGIYSTESTGLAAIYLRIELSIGLPRLLTNCLFFRLEKANNEAIVEN